MKTILLILGLCLSVYADLSKNSLCNSVEAQQSCGQCTKTHVDCAWCMDPHSKLKNRCQLASSLNNESCQPHLLYSPMAFQVKKLQNLQLKTKQHDGKTTVRLQPQATSVRLMPGYSASVDFKYLHQMTPIQENSNQELMEIQTSDFKHSPLKLKFFIFCEGEWVETKSCRVYDNQIMEFKIELSVDSCSKTGDITLSVGVLGQRTISGIYITTMCGCECEKHPEMNSEFCNRNGHLVCGQCVCNLSHGGEKCECPSNENELTTISLLEESCKNNSTSPVCSNNGKCLCGRCKCSKTTVSGEFCECDNVACPVSGSGKLCSGNGICDCGVCKCELGWRGSDCSCSTSEENCLENIDNIKLSSNLSLSDMDTGSKSTPSTQLASSPTDEDFGSKVDNISLTKGKSYTYTITSLFCFVSLFILLKI